MRGLLCSDGSCTKCEREQRAVDDNLALRRCKAELKELKAKQKEEKWAIEIGGQAFTGLTHERAKAKAKALVDLGIWFIKLKSDE